MDAIQTYQPFIGTLVTLVAAIIGFSGVIYSQRRLARVAEEGRSHQERMAREQAERQRLSEIRSFINAIIGELSALQFSLENAVKALAAQISIAEELARMANARKTQPRVVFHFPTPVFDSLVSRIGLLSPEMSYEVSKTYGQIKSYSIQDQAQVPDMDAALASHIMRSVQDNLRKLQAEAEALKKSLVASAAAS
jgi:hypothetical protein